KHKEGPQVPKDFTFETWVAMSALPLSLHKKEMPNRISFLQGAPSATPKSHQILKKVKKIIYNSL
ncbi:MAG: hypothetical protein IJZ71_09555, partial [Treponema sp.]|nr:hypothetical protein [Clostridia bacterium]MBQ8777716.1 hypothetical protein [Treponema sp.]